MRMLLTVLITTLAISAGQAFTDRQIDSLIAVMTLEEKLGQLNQLGGGWDSTGVNHINPDHARMVREGRVGSFLNVLGAAHTREVQQLAVEQSRLRIPLIFGYDVIHGYRTTFPIPLAEACSWDPDLARATAHAAAQEASAYGVHWTFAPMVDIARDPRWGRIAEGSGEDPYLGSVMAAARVTGFQGTDLKAQGSIVACAKHYAAYGGAEAGRDYNTVDISERTLREIYLPPFHAAVDAGVGTLMSSFNEIGGVPSTANHWLLTQVLRDEWGFRGFVVSDWTSVAELQPHGVAAMPSDAGVLALNAGVDMDMASRIYADSLARRVRDGRVSMATLETSVRRILRMKAELGLFEHPYRNCDPAREKTETLTPAHVALARTAAQKSIVLLKNSGVLPVAREVTKVAVIGPLADRARDVLGPWDGSGRPENAVTVLAGLRARQGISVTYAQGCRVIDSGAVDFGPAVKAARAAQLVVLVVGEASSMSGEAASRSMIGLPGRQADLVRAVRKAGVPVVMVLLNGRPLVLSDVVAEADAIVEAWFGGIQTGNAVADVLFGDVNPGGKLVTTFPRNEGQIPLYYNHKNTGRPPTEDRFTSKYLDIPVTPLYPFGFGLSYTTFSFSDLTLSADRIRTGDTLDVAVTVSNTGSRDGDEVVQLYLRDDVGSVTRPVRELRRFRRITLKAGEKKIVRFTLHPADLAMYNLSMQRVVEPGMFHVYAGGNSVDLIEKAFEVRE